MRLGAGRGHRTDLVRTTGARPDVRSRARITAGSSSVSGTLIAATLEADPRWRIGASHRNPSVRTTGAIWVSVSIARASGSDQRRKGGCLHRHAPTHGHPCTSAAVSRPASTASAVSNALAARGNTRSGSAWNARAPGTCSHGSGDRSAIPARPDDQQIQGGAAQGELLGRMTVRGVRLYITEGGNPIASLGHRRPGRRVREPHAYSSRLL